MIGRHIRNRPCPVTSRINPCASIQARFRWTAARLLPVRASAIGAETSGHSVSTERRAGGVFPERSAISVSARIDHASISSRWRVAVRHAVAIPSSHRARRSAGGPPALSPPAPPMAIGTKKAPLPSLAAIRAAVTAASIWSPCCPRPARLQTWKPRQERVIGCRSAACSIRSSQPLSLFLHDFTAWFSHDFRKVPPEVARVSALRFQFHYGLQ